MSGLVNNVHLSSVDNIVQYLNVYSSKYIYEYFSTQLVALTPQLNVTKYAINAFS